MFGPIPPDIRPESNVHDLLSFCSAAKHLRHL